MLHSNNFSLKSKREKRSLLAQIEGADFVKNDWQMLKNLYKNLEAEPDAALLVALIYKIDNTTPNSLKGAFPSPKTLAYMKRRIVRFLKKLAIEDVELFLKISKELLLQTTKIDFDHQWITTKILFGTSKRLEQKRHGRGKFFLKNNIPNIYRTEEIGAAAWNQFPSIAYVILDAPNLATEVYEFTVKLLLRNKKNIPFLSQKQIEIFFDSNSPWLQKLAANQCYDLTIKAVLSNEVLHAKAYFFGNKTQRQEFQKSSFEIKKDSEEKNIFNKVKLLLARDKEKHYSLDLFINSLFETALKYFENKGIYSKRVAETMNFIKHFEQKLNPISVRKFANTLLKTQNPDLEDLVYANILSSSIENAASWFTTLSVSRKAQRQQFFQIFKQKWESLYDAKKKVLAHGWLENTNFQVADFGWHVLKNYSNRRDVADQFFQQHFSRWNKPTMQSLKNMANSKDGSGLFWELCDDNLKNVQWDNKLLVYLINESNESLQKGLIGILIKKARTRVFEWLPQIAQLEERDEIIKSILPKIPNQNQISPNIFKFLNSKNYWFSTISWQIFIERYNKPNLIQQVVWQVAFRDQKEWTSFLNRLFQSTNESFKNNVLTVFSQLIQQEPSFAQKIASVFGQIAASFDNQTIIQILEIVDGNAWSQIKPTILTYLKGEKGQEIWIAILRNLNKINTPTSEKTNPNETIQNDSLSQRILADRHLRNTLLKVPRPEVLECHHPPLEDLLLNWAAEHKYLFSANSPVLFSACTHRLSKIRTWGLQIAQKQKLDSIFSLQLMESGLPDASNIGNQYFEQIRAGSSDELDAVLTLIDSPNEATRTYGRTYFQQRKEGMESNLAIQCLTEHTDPLVQEFVAQKLNKNTHSKTKESFDRAVLRTKNKARKAKELVKNRLEKDLDFQPSILLELARGQNKKDQEWAIEQLAKLALIGETVNGFELLPVQK